MQALFSNVRFYVLVCSVVGSLLVYYSVISLLPPGSLVIIRLTQLYAWIALAYLYVTLLIGPVVYMWRWLPWRGTIYKARRAIGVSVFYFALLHACFAFFGQLGGFAGLPFLPPRFLIAISFSFTALCILGAMAATSFDKMVVKLTHRRWKFLHRFVYLAGVLILVHAVMLGTHFQHLLNPLPQFTLIALLFLLFLEARRGDAYVQKRWPTRGPRGIVTFLFIVSAVVLVIYLAVSPPSLQH